MADVAQYAGKRHAADNAGCAFLSEKSGKTEYRERKQIVEYKADDQRRNAQSPAQCRCKVNDELYERIGKCSAQPVP